MNNVPPFISSLHRPFNQNLKTARWVCLFIKARKGKIKSSDLNVGFYLFMLRVLRKEYQQSDVANLPGLPSKQAILDVSAYLSIFNKEERSAKIQEILQIDRSSGIDMQIYSTYKAASYFVNMAKDKLSLVSIDNLLTADGETLLAIRSSLYKFTAPERRFYFSLLLKADFLLLISLCLIKRIAYKEKVKDYLSFHYLFLDKYYSIKDFNFKHSSLGNFDNVRSFWLEMLEVLDKRMIIKPTYQKIIENNEQFSSWYSDVLSKFELFEAKEFASYVGFSRNKKRFESSYLKLQSRGESDFGYVNLYDIKESFRLSTSRFEELINRYYELEKGKKDIFFINTVNSIDRRERFSVRGKPVLKIKIKLTNDNR